MLKYVFVALFASLITSVGLASAEYQPRAEAVADNVYTLVGPLGQRSADNDGLNANYAFVITAQGEILIDSGASRLGAEKLATAIRAVTPQPVRWVINTGSQDHRWLGNDYFAQHGAQIVALKRTAATQAQFADQHLAGLERLLGDRLAGTKALSAPYLLDGDPVTLTLGGETLELRYTDAHFPGDALVWLPKQKIAVTGDLVFVDRLLGVLPWSSVKKARQAFRMLETLQPARIVPGHGRVCDLAQAKRETGDYDDFLADTIGTAARDMQAMSAVLDRYADLSAFRHLENYAGLHRANMNRAFIEFESE